MSIEETKAKLIESGKLDQGIRKQLFKDSVSDELYEELDKIDSENNKLIKQVISEHGLVTISKFGQEASMYAFLLVQHMSDDELPVMIDYLQRMKDNIKDINKQYLALLEDRVLIYSGKKQIYGTQLTLNDSTGKYESLHIEDPDNVNIRRSEIGLGTLEEYLSDAD